MNFKKYQRRIPMNFKKIIPLTFTALCVAGALSACSDSTVVGADSQDNSVAERLDEKEIASKAAALLKGSSKLNAATTVIISSEYNEDRTQKISSTEVLDGDEAYVNAMNSIIDIDTINTSYATAKGWMHGREPSGLEYHLYFGGAYSMQDEYGVTYGPIYSDESAVKMGDGWHSVKSVYCWNESKWYTLNDSVYEFSEHFTAYAHYDYAKIDLDYSSRDSLALNQFVEDCIADSGTIFKSGLAIDGQRYQPQLRCTLVMLNENPIRISHWKKYASSVIDNCRSDIVLEMKAPKVYCPPEKCDGPDFVW